MSPLLTLTVAWLAIVPFDGPDEPVAPPRADAAQDAPALEADTPDDPTDDDADGPDESLVTALEAAEQRTAEGGLLYSADLSDDELARRWKEHPGSLGSISVGNAEAGRLINGVPMPEPFNPAWYVVDPSGTYGTQETIDALVATANMVHQQLPHLPPLRVNHISRKEGGWHPPHRTHQSGRDVDLGFFWIHGVTQRQIKHQKDRLMDVASNWALLKAIITQGDVQLVLVDKRVQEKLYAHALAQGENKAWLDGLFHAGPKSLVHHARRHRDHFHVRYYAGRSQELGRRIVPLLAKSAQENVAFHRVKKGDTLGALAVRYRSTVKLIQARNSLKGHMLSIGRTLQIPVRGPCTDCPVPPPVVVPPRRLPPANETAAVDRPLSERANRPDERPVVSP